MIRLQSHDSFALDALCCACRLHAARAAATSATGEDMLVLRQIL
jgi:hypothetical protein